MKAVYLNSIQQISKQYETNGSSPVKVMCNDTNEYVCKYFRSNTGKAVKLFNEYLASSFLKIWNLKTPDFTFVKIKKNHLIPNLNYVWFDKYCFGSKFVKATEIDLFSFDAFSRLDKNKNYIFQDLLMIGLFDIWLCNEDRNLNNTNLLYNESEKSLIPIDHTEIYNSNGLDMKPTLLTDFETILTQKFIKTFFSKKYYYSNFENFHKKAKNNFYLYTKNCEKNLDEILNKIPKVWDLDISYLKKSLNIYFSSTWKQEVLKTFEYFLSIIF